MTVNQTAEETRAVRVGQVSVNIAADDTVADLLERSSNGSGLQPDPEHTAVFRAQDWDGDSYPDLDDKVPFDLSTVEDGDALELYRMKNSDRPVYKVSA